MENYKSKEENWGRTKETGNMTEQLVANVLRKMGYQVTDVSEDQRCYNKGDLFCVDKHGKQSFVDAKSDKQINLYHNLIIENGIDRCDGRGKQQGWSFTGKYNYIIFCDGVTQMMYCVDFPKLISLGKKLAWKETHGWNENEHAYIYKQLIPIKTASDNGILLAQWNYTDDGHYSNFITY